jgi:hypothetical protein
MAPIAQPDLTMPLIPEAAQRHRGPVRLAPFVPITVALIGLAFILFGGVGVRASSERPAASVTITTALR